MLLDVFPAKADPRFRSLSLWDGEEGMRHGHSATDTRGVRSPSKEAPVDVTESSWELGEGDRGGAGGTCQALPIKVNEFGNFD